MDNYEKSHFIKMSSNNILKCFFKSTQVFVGDIKTRITSERSHVRVKKPFSFEPIWTFLSSSASPSCFPLGVGSGDQSTLHLEINTCTFCSSLLLSYIGLHNKRNFLKHERVNRHLFYLRLTTKRTKFAIVTTRLLSSVSLEIWVMF